MTTGGNGVCCVGGVTLVGYRWPNVASAWATRRVACVLMGPIDSEDMDATVWCWDVQILVDCVKCNRG